jgi:CBS domain-containing protein
MLVKEALKGKGRAIISTTPSTPIRRAMELLLQNHISCLPVVDESDTLVGIVSDKDIFKLLYDDEQASRNGVVADVMTREVIVGLLDDDLGYIAGVMTNNRVRHVPIMDGKRLVGLMSVGDIVKTQMSHYEIENRYLRQYIEGNYPA